MQTKFKLISAHLALGVMMISGCGSDSDSSGSTNTNANAFSKTGTITSVGNGNVKVGKTSYSTAGASVTLDGVSGSTNELRNGMVVTLKGTRAGVAAVSSKTSFKAATDTATITTIEFEDELEGPVSSIATDKSSFVILGVTVSVDDMTTYEGVTLDAIAVGNVLEVSGFQSTPGTVLATSVELEAEQYVEGTEIEVKGVISALDDAAKTFSIGTQIVDYNTAVISEIPDGVLANDMFVEVTTIQNLDANSVLIASKVEGEDDDIDGDEGDEVELEGVVTAFTDANNFSVNEQPVITTADTEFEDGTENNLDVGVKLEVEGELNADGVLVAEEVSFEIDSDINVSAPVSKVDAANNTITVLGVTLNIDEATMFNDETATTSVEFSLTDLLEGDYVEISAFMKGADIIISKLDKVVAKDTVELQGFLKSFEEINKSVVVMGINIVIDENGVTPETLNLFFAALEKAMKENKALLLEFKGIYDSASNTVTATKFEFSD